MSPTIGRLAAITAAVVMTACGTDLSPSESARSEPVVASIVPGTYAESTRDDLTIHRDLGSPTVVSTLNSGEWLLTLSTPTEIDGTAWIRVEYGGGRFGWIGVDPDRPPLARVEPDCPAGPADRVLEVADVVGLTIAERLSCFGANEITLSPVTWRMLPSDIPYRGEPGWLADDASLQLYGRGGWDLEEPLPAHIEPGAGSGDPVEEWASIRGRFDHPASADCVRDIDVDGFVNEEEVIADLAPMAREDGVLWCRQQFVITDVAPIAAPPPVPEPRAPPAGGSWRAIPEAPLVGRSENGAVWTGSEMVVWGGRATEGASSGYEYFSAADGAAYDPVENTWRLLAEAPIEGRALPGMVWTGSEVLVLGGFGEGFEPLTDGARYDPSANAWRAMAPIPPSMAGGPTALTWTGRELIAVAHDGTRGASYDPDDDAWRELPTPPLRGDLWNIGLVWTGEEAIALAYPNGISATAVGAAYDPGTDAWRELPESPIVALNGLSPVWIGGEMLVISRSLHTGQPETVPPDTTYVSVYDPETDSWRTAGAQEAYLPTAAGVWTGQRVITGEAAYDPAADAWLALPPRPSREGPLPVWTGQEILLWGGGPRGEGLIRFNDGFAYRPDD